jgi:putative transposase
MSMTEEYEPYENAVAERAKAILKKEFRLDDIFENYELL